MRTNTGQIVHLENYRRPISYSERVDRTFELDPEGNEGRARMIFHRPRKASALCTDRSDGDELTHDRHCCSTRSDSRHAL